MPFEPVGRRVGRVRPSSTSTTTAAPRCCVTGWCSRGRRAPTWAATRCACSSRPLRTARSRWCSTSTKTASPSSSPARESTRGAPHARVGARELVRAFELRGRGLRRRSGGRGRPRRLDLDALHRHGPPRGGRGVGGVRARRHARRSHRLRPRGAPGRRPGGASPTVADFDGDGAPRGGHGGCAGLLGDRPRLRGRADDRARGRTLRLGQHHGRALVAALAGREFERHGQHLVRLRGRRARRGGVRRRVLRAGLRRAHGGRALLAAPLVVHLVREPRGGRRRRRLPRGDRRGEQLQLRLGHDGDRVSWGRGAQRRHALRGRAVPDRARLPLGRVRRGLLPLRGRRPVLPRREADARAPASARTCAPRSP